MIVIWKRKKFNLLKKNRSKVFLWLKACCNTKFDHLLTALQCVYEVITLVQAHQCSYTQTRLYRTAGGRSNSFVITRDHYNRVSLYGWSPFVPEYFVRCNQEKVIHEFFENLMQCNQWMCSNDVWQLGISNPKEPKNTCFYHSYWFTFIFEKCATIYYKLIKV